MPPTSHAIVRANGLRFAYFEEGKGPLVLLLHGFPDTAHTWDAVRPALAAAGYRAVSPFMRGYRVVHMPGGHFMHREHPERFIQELLGALPAR